MRSIPFIDFKTATELNDAERSRISSAAERCERATGSAAKYVIRTPGRINLIGDHIDYHGFPVLPMAIENCIFLCVSTPSPGSQTGDLAQKVPDKKKRLVIVNAKQELYPTYQCEHSFSYGSELDQFHQWHHYVLCGYHGILSKELLRLQASQIYEHTKRLASCNGTHPTGNQKRCSTAQLDDEHLNELDNLVLFVDSDLPPASGLSSSSALVCASALATLLFLRECKSTDEGDSKSDPLIDSETLAEDCANFEHLIGTRGGGMDQAIILTAQEKRAKHVEFEPKFSCSNVNLPDGVVLLVSHCGESFPKAATHEFNSRVLETKLAAALILKKLKPLSNIAIDHTITFHKVKNELLNPDSFASELLTAIKDKLPETLSFDEAASHLELSRTDLMSRFNASENFLIKTGLNTRVQLLRRCKHVCEEADRVQKFKMLCETVGDPVTLGKLMTESHISLRDNYECSHPALEKIFETALKAGALGARLTGAGWGGCIVSLVDSNSVDMVMGELEKVSKFTFRTEPRSGAVIFKIT
jgi:N-acetylgalactosamine kinase